MSFGNSLPKNPDEVFGPQSGDPKPIAAREIQEMSGRRSYTARAEDMPTAPPFPTMPTVPGRMLAPPPPAPGAVPRTPRAVPTAAPALWTPPVAANHLTGAFGTVRGTPPRIAHRPATPRVDRPAAAPRPAVSARPSVEARPAVPEPPRSVRRHVVRAGDVPPKTPPAPPKPGHPPRVPGRR
ncbi:hypothetical protein Val02_60260 [Virgisporangium aliadipatigenens]|uniref:Uncharacterized protein n=1 Tax=Virgisporangium aliadipatigenens TaxID=741659 RepID=A0A8J3YSH6_9ACTN|nr:hypothetical protein [Virgisporangium aliadipatigenens]GIJ49140.1 hypothetical protein Val02_60260 [Virgisporangium aliadipatigenens]